MDYKSLATVEGADNYQEAAIILEGPPIEIFPQRAAPTAVLKRLRQTQGKFYFECKTSTGGCMQLGWADESFTAIADEGKGCAAYQHSWAYDGMRGLKHQPVEREKEIGVHILHTAFFTFPMVLTRRICKSSFS